MMRALSTTVSPALHRKVLVIVHGDARQRRHRLALRSGRDHHDLARIGLHDVLRAQQNAVGNAQQSERMRDLGDVVHAAAEERHFAPVLGGQIQDLLQAMDGRAEARDHQPPLGAIENFVQPGAHGAFALGVAGPIDIGGIGQQQQHAALAVVGEGVQVEQVRCRWGWGPL